MASHKNPGSEHFRATRELARILYAQYFWNKQTPPSYNRLGTALRALHGKLDCLLHQFQTNHQAQEAFFQLTADLPDLLEDLKEKLPSLLGDVGAETPGADEALGRKNLIWIQLARSRVTHYSFAVETIKEAIERVFAPTSNNGEGLAGNNNRDRSERLENRLRHFLNGLPQGRGGYASGNRPNYTLDTLQRSRQEDAMMIESRLQENLKEAPIASIPSENPDLWRIRHSMWWFSQICNASGDSQQTHISSYVRPRHNDREEQEIMAKKFLDLIKSAWLLSGLVKSPGFDRFNAVVKEGVTILEGRLLEQIDLLYDEVSGTPDYNLISNQGDFQIAMPGTRSSTIVLDHAQDGTFNSRSNFEAEPDWVQRPQMQTFSYPSAQRPIITPMTFDRENQTSRSTQGVTHLQESHHVRNESTRSAPHSYALQSPREMVDGLHVSSLEQRVLAKCIDDIHAEEDEIEIVNRELSDGQKLLSRLKGFYEGVSCTEETEAHHATYLPARVRIFKNKRNGEFHLWTGREDNPVKECIIHPSTQLVPIYAFADDRSNGLEKSGIAEIYLRHQGTQCSRGTQCSLRYRFKSPNPLGVSFPYELLGFQGALLGLQFEQEYKVSIVNFWRKGKPKPETESYPRFQIWTEVSEEKDFSAPGSRYPPQLAPKTFKMNFDEALNRINVSKIFVYFSDQIYVLIVSDRITIDELSHNRGDKRRLRIIPNRRSGSTTVRVRKIRGFHDRKAGIPLDQSGIRYADQLGVGFDDFTSVEIQFYAEKHASDFIDDFTNQLAEWKNRCAHVEEFRELQRNRKIVVRSTTTFDTE